MCGVPFIDPSRPAGVAGRTSFASSFARAKCRQERAGIGQQHVIGGLIVFQLLVTAVDTHQGLFFGERTAGLPKFI